MERENRYVVLKIKDIENYLTPDDQLTLRELIAVINNGRTLDRKPYNKNCVVVEEDWPMYEDTWKAIENWVDGNS